MSKWTADERLALNAMRGSTGNNLALLGLGFVRQVFMAIFDGGIVFIPAAAISGFVAWLAGAENPRTVALTVGGFLGALWASWLILAWVSKVVGSVIKAVQQHRLEKAIENADSK